MRLRSLLSRRAGAGRSGRRNGPDNGHDPDYEEEAVETAWHGREGWLICEGVQKTYKKRMVVKGVSVAVGRGEAVGLLGPNGAGKTTVFYMITGLVPADAG